MRRLIAWGLVAVLSVSAVDAVAEGPFRYIWERRKAELSSQLSRDVTRKVNVRVEAAKQELEASLSAKVAAEAANLQEQVASHLRRRILSGRILPGTPLREQNLAVEFGISRGPIRDALLHLTKEGLLLAKPNVGVRVAAEPSAFKRHVIVHLRREIEASAVTELQRARRYRPGHARRTRVGSPRSPEATHCVRRTPTRWRPGQQETALITQRQ